MDFKETAINQQEKPNLFLSLFIWAVVSLEVFSISTVLAVVYKNKNFIKKLSLLFLLNARFSGASSS